MDAQERLNTEDLARPDYLAASHLHRYALAAELCAGLRVLDLCCGTGYGTELLAGRAASALGVDLDPAAIRQAEAEHAGGGARFETGDALELLRRTQPGDHDAIVMFEGLEHLPDHEAVLEELRRLHEGGTRLVVSVPNSRAFGEENDFHLTDFGYDETRRAFERFGAGVTYLYQHLAEGSLILPEDGGDAFAGEVGALEQGEPEYANTFIAVIGFDGPAMRAATVRMNLVSTPNHNRYMLGLERANAEYFRMNRQLARGVYGKHDAAAAVAAWKLEQLIWAEQAKVEAAEQRAEALEKQLREVEVALHQQWAWHDAGRYHLMDRAVAAVKAVPGLYPVLKGLHRAVRALSRGGR